MPLPCRMRRRRDFSCRTLPIPAISIVVGGGETDEYVRKSRAFADKWRESAGPLSYFETAGHDHFALIEAITERHDPLAAILLRHLGLR